MSKLATSFALALCLFAHGTSGTIALADFPQFRGPRGWGVANGQPIPTTWSAEQNLTWRVAVPGAGWSAPVIIGDRLYLTSAVAEDGRKPKNFADGVKTPQSMGLGTFTPAPNISIAWTVFCLDKNTGEILWQKVIETAKPQYAIHPSNSYATETPVADLQGIYVYFGAIGKVVALNHFGELLWQHDIGVFKTSNNFGTGSSLAIHQGKVFVQNFSEGSADLICFDCASGQEQWRNKRDRNATSWSSPLVWDNQQRVELIVSGGEQVDSFDPSSGSRLWTLNKVKAATACSVTADAQRLYFGGSDPFFSGPLFAVSAGGWEIYLQ
jgi:outer membrane protein assembly factor BamB